METLIQDLRYAVRMLVKRPGFTAIAVLTLALGIGANTTIFNVVNSVLLRSLPYPDPDRLVVLSEHNPEVGTMSVAWPNFTDWRDQNESFESMAAYRLFGFNLTDGDEPVRVLGGEVSADFFSLLGGDALLGRVLTEADDKPGATRVVVLSYRLWQSRFGGNRDIIGRSLNLDGASSTVVGVMPAGFQFFIQPAEIYVSTGRQAAGAIWQDRVNHPGLRVLARLKAGVSAERAQADLNVIASRLEQQYPKSNGGQSVETISLYEFRFGKVRAGMYLLLAAVGLVLLISCANVANLLLSRATTRQNEIAIRAAIGASRARLLRQLLTESVLLSLIGGGLGLLLMLWGMEPLLKIAPQDIPRLSNTRVDAVVLCYTLGVSMLTGIVFGLAPALFASKVDLTAALKQGARGRMSGSSRELLKVGFLITEVALAVIVVIGAGLLARSIVRLYAVDPGFNAQNVLALDVSLPESKYKGAERRSFFKQATERISALPGVQSAAVALSLPLTGGAWGSVYVVEGRPIPAQSELPSTPINVVDPQYFRLMEIPLLRGRHFTDFDNANSPRVTIINKSMADRWWPNDDPIGKRIKQGFPEGQGPYLEIVGVVADVKQSTLDGLDQTEIYLADTQEPMGSMSIVVKTVSDPLLLAAAIKREIYEIDKDQPVRGIQPMSRYLSESTARKRFLTLLLGFFAAVALLLAAMGVYGVMSYSVASRKHEIGIRMALGAKSSDVLKLVLGQAALFAAIGLGIGLGTAFVVTQWMASELFEVSAQDPLTFILVPVMLAGVALLASYIPARRAIAIDPMIALRYE